MYNPSELINLLIGLFKGELARIRYPKNILDESILLSTAEIVDVLNPTITEPGRIVSGWLDGQDGNYTGLSYEWLEESAMEQFEEYLEAEGVSDYRSENNDCDDYAFEFVRFVKRACAREGRYNPLCIYVKIPGHALCATITGRGLTFSDPTRLDGVVLQPSIILWEQF